MSERGTATPAICALETSASAGAVVFVVLEDELCAIVSSGRFGSCSARVILAPGLVRRFKPVNRRGSWKVEPLPEPVPF